jgi:hypothetical protein
VEYLNDFGSTITNDAKCGCKIKYKIAAFKNKKAFCLKIGFKFKEETSEVLNVEHTFERC